MQVKIKEIHIQMFISSIPSLIYLMFFVTKPFLIVTSNIPFEDFEADERNGQNYQ